MSHPEPAPSLPRFGGINDVLRLVPFGRTRLYQMVAAECFPAPVKPSAAERGHNKWNLAEVEDWLRQLDAKRVIPTRVRRDREPARP